MPHIKKRLLCLLSFFYCADAEGLLHQHRVRSSKRKLSYRRNQRATSRFWIPHELSKDTSSQQSIRRSSPLASLRAHDRESESGSSSDKTRRQASKTAGESYWYVQSDTSVFASSTLEEWHRERRKSRRDRQLLESEAPRVPPSASGHRRSQVENKFAASDAGTEVQVGKTHPAAETEEVEGILTEGTTGNSTEDGWNVTSEVENANATASDETVVYTTATSTQANDTNTTSFSYQPIRVRAILSEQDHGGTFLNASEREALFQDILSPAILAWSAALRVNPVVGNLTVDADQLYDGETCGPGIDSGSPSVPVPPSHLRIGMPDTDLVVYLSIAFARESSESESRASDSPVAWDNNSGDETDTNLAFPGFRWRRDPEKLTWNPPPTCSGEYLAAASYCSTDQYDRPTAGMLHLCIDEEFFSESLLERNIVTIMHELAHILGFNTQSLAHFRHSDGSPITPRVNGDVVDTKVECTGPNPRLTQIVPLPSEDVLQFRTVRGVRVAEVVTPSVRQVVRNHFDCQTLTGAELESGLVLRAINSSDAARLEGSCIGDHWERRLLREDLMNPVLDEVPFTLKISSVTLALLADSGWYQVDLSRTAYPSAWGRGAGCSFVEDSCLSGDGQVPSVNRPFFCNDAVSILQEGTTAEIHGCSPDLSSKATCSISRYDSDLPMEYQYFGDSYGSSIGGNDPFLDYCPVFSGFSNGACRDRRAKTLMQVSDIESFGGRNARCVSGNYRGLQTAFCLPTACIIEDRSLRVRVAKVWQRCDKGGQLLYSREGDASTVICPDPIRACPVFYCRRDCLGTGGSCDYATGECVCESFSITNATNTNTTNGTAVAPSGDNTTLGLESGMCDDLSPQGQGHFYSEAQDSQSPLADPVVGDYYYPTEEDLAEDGRLLLPWMIALISVGGFGFFSIAVGLIVVRYLRRGRSSSLDWFRTSESPASLSVGHDQRSSKDKFVASMLVDIRLHDPLAENLSETDGSMTETDGGSEKLTVVSSLNRSACDTDNSIRSDTSETPSDLSAPQLPAHESEAAAKSTMRKRVVNDGI